MYEAEDIFMHDKEYELKQRITDLVREIVPKEYKNPADDCTDENEYYERVGHNVCRTEILRRLE